MTRAEATTRIAALAAAFEARANEMVEATDEARDDALEALHMSQAADRAACLLTLAAHDREPPDARCPECNEAIAARRRRS